MSTSTPMTTTAGQHPGVPHRAATPDTRASGVDPAAGAVVVGIDGSECSLGAVRWAAHEAVRRSARLHILHAAPYLSRPAEEGAASPALPRARRIAAQAFTAARHAEHDVVAETEIVPEDPVDALLRAAPSAELLVLGITTTGAADELVLAPVAHRVVARSPRPVVVVPRSRGSIPAGRPVVIVLGLSEEEDDESVLEFAAAAALRSGAPLSVLRLRPGRSHDLAAWQQRFPGLDVAVTEMQNAPPHRVLAAACPTPLMVLAEGRSSRLHRNPDGAHRFLLRHCTSPMALIPATTVAATASSAPSSAEPTG